MAEAEGGTAGLLAELGLQAFEAEFRARWGADLRGQLAHVRYADLLQLGMSKVQCHLFLQKVSSLSPGLRSMGDGAADIDFEVVDIDDPALASQLADNALRADPGERGAADAALDDAAAALLAQASQPASDCQGPRSCSPATEVIAAELRQLMPPPQGSPAPDALSCPASAAPSQAASAPPRSSRKRAHSSHLSTAVAHGSEQHSTVGSASGSSSSSLHMDIRVKKRRVMDWNQHGRSASRCGYREGSPCDPHTGAGARPVGDAESIPAEGFGPAPSEYAWRERASGAETFSETGAV